MIALDLMKPCFRIDRRSFCRHMWQHTVKQVSQAGSRLVAPKGCRPVIMPICNVDTAAVRDSNWEAGPDLELALYATGKDQRGRHQGKGRRGGSCREAAAAAGERQVPGSGMAGSIGGYSRKGWSGGRGRFHGASGARCVVWRPLRITPGTRAVPDAWHWHDEAAGALQQTTTVGQVQPMSRSQKHGNMKLFTLTL